MALGASGKRVAAVRRMIRSTKTIDHFAFLDHVSAYREFRRIFADHPSFVSGITAIDLPVSFQIDFAPRMKVAPWITGVRMLSGVVKVTRPGAPMRRMMTHPDEFARFCAQLRLVYEVYMQIDASPEQTSAVQHWLEQESGVVLLSVLTKDGQLHEMLSDGTGSLAATPSSGFWTTFRVRIVKNSANGVIASLRSLSGVDGISSANKGCQDSGLRSTND